METTSLKLVFIIAIMFPTANPVILKDHANCTLPFHQVSTDHMVPIRIDVTIQVKPRSILSGKTDITIIVKKPTTNITLHGHDLEIDMACTMIMRPGAKPKCREEDAVYKLWEVVYCSENETINLIFIDYISPGQYILHIEHFSLLDKNENVMIYLYSWKNEARWIVTNLYSSNAIRRLFPSWDNATIKEYLHITVIYDKPYMIFLNIPIQYSHDENNSRKTLFSDIYKTSTHSLTFLFISGLTTNIKQYDMNYLWNEPNATVALEYAHIVAFHTTLQFKWIINIVLSEIINKIDHIVLPTCPMKSAGRLELIVYREKDVTYKEGVDSPGKMIDIAKLVSYEMSRQLFVGIMNSHLNIEDKWFDEILASFYSFYIVDKIWLGKEMMELFVVQNLQTALDSDIYLELKPTIHKSKSDYGIDGLLYPLLYHKKAFALFRMLLNLLTPPKFDEIIKKYVHSRNTNFWTIVEEVYLEKYIKKCTIKEIMNSWLTEAHHLEMHFIRDYNKETVMYNPMYPNNAFNFKMPITFRTNLKFYFTVFWCGRNDINIFRGINSNYFFLVNTEQVGYYRVNYDSRNWLLLAEYLQSANSTPIAVLNRAQIVNDAFYFTTFWKMESQLFFDVIKFLNEESNYIVWHPMFNIFSYMSAFLKTPIGDSAKAKFLSILNSLLHRVGYEEREADREMTMPLRLLAIKWACEFGLEECRNAVAEKMIAYIHNSEQNIIARWTNWIHCIGMMNINTTILELIWQLNIQEENIEILESLSCIEDDITLLHFLQLMTNITYENNATKLSMGKIHRFIIKRHIEKQKILNYFLNNYFKIIDRFPNDFGTHDNLTLIADIIMNAHSQMTLSKIKIHITQNFDDHRLGINSRNMIEIRQEHILRQRRKFKIFEN
ncbi:glutamyl aminopeptidase-like [Odontomachus brunneus]|uniref:glutamyl aminopeptidase-like n=1 Tax=Odontomachus brunneus TaxID=486640 RepID=UPI0013F29F8A|nr:glutamyl aminopeptidase-like [Odontomachus brunneus]